MTTSNIINNRNLASDAAFVAKRMTSSFVNELLNLTVTPEQVSEASMNQKGIKRLVQLVSFAVSGNIKDYDAVTAFMVSATLLSKQSTIKFSDAIYLCGAGVDEAQHIKGVSRARLARHLGDAGTINTIKAKVSRTTGKRGFFTALGVSAKSDAHSFTLTDSAKTNPLLLAYAHQLDKMTDSALQLLKQDKKAK